MELYSKKKRQEKGKGGKQVERKNNSTVMKDYHDKGCIVIPTCKETGKKPKVRFGHYSVQSPPSKDIVDSWIEQFGEDLNIALMTNDLLVLDFDTSKDTGLETYKLIQEAEKASNVVVKTTRGIHAYFINNGENAQRHEFEDGSGIDIITGPNKLVKLPGTIDSNGFETVFIKGGHEEIQLRKLTIVPPGLLQKIQEKSNKEILKMKREGKKIKGTGRNSKQVKLIAKLWHTHHSIGKMTAEEVAGFVQQVDEEQNVPAYYSDPKEGHKHKDPYLNALETVKSVFASIERGEKKKGKKKPQK